MRLTPPLSSLFFSKNDPQDQRLGDFVRACEVTDLLVDEIAIWGSPDDEGIRLNGGRPGAALAPEEIRKYFYKMTPPARGAFPQNLADLGNLSLTGALSDRHERGRGIAQDVHRKKSFALSLGGGHDYGFPDAAGFLDVFQNQNPLVINFDAHLDVRPLDKGLHSGTPFRRLIETFPKKFEFWELGLQPQCNSKNHADWAEARGAQLVFLEELLISNSGLLPQPNLSRPCFVSLDIDVFSSKEAPGCSQSWATGLLIENYLPWMQFLFDSFDVRGLGIYEVSPALDIDHRTSKLAALVMFHALKMRAQKGSRHA